MSSTQPHSSSSSSETQNKSGSDVDTQSVAVKAGITGAVGTVLLLAMIFFCCRKIRRSNHATRKRWQSRVTPFLLSSFPDINQNLSTPVGFRSSRGKEGRHSEMATNRGGGNSVDPAPTGRNVLNSAPFQVGFAGRVLNRVKTAFEEERDDNAHQEASNQMVGGDSQRTEHPILDPAPDRPNILRHLDSGIRIIQGRVRPTGGGRPRAVIEEAIELPPEYSLV
ncbi:hypothetical protein K435DRAFT_864389 [Dendrothele bispora CBS 962.96]|uniref:Uncharacterized protein n=1 Tax=Dendrothele bispora (strain CBS 962.96) TaxID=1314807 RepID=A0A4S8LNN3_DENBC|nr:hypothetical protein K435DRAFT_864389 [Dendrothele bispora CBS 962.96]